MCFHMSLTIFFGFPNIFPSVLLSEYFPLTCSNPWPSLLLTLIYPSSHLLIYFLGGQMHHEVKRALFLHQGLNPCPLHWKCRVWTVGLLGSFSYCLFQFYNVYLILLKINSNFLMKLSIFSPVSSIFSSVFLNISSVTIVKSLSANSSAYITWGSASIVLFFKILVICFC